MNQNLTDRVDSLPTLDPYNTKKTKVNFLRGQRGGGEGQGTPTILQKEGRGNQEAH